VKSRWVTYLTERFPLIPNLLIAIGIAFSAKAIAGGTREGLTPVWISILGGVLFLGQIRFMDEYKDFEKDKIAHPERPLPRGLFSLAEFESFIRVFNFSMFGISILAGVLISIRAGIYFAIGTVYLYLMFKEFFLKNWLSDRPLLYAITHQVIIIPMCAFVLECFQSDALTSHGFISFSGLLLFSFFGFEVGRKLDPEAHPILNTYLSRYGREKTAFLVLVLLGLSLKAGEALGLNLILGPLYVAIMVLLSLLWWAPSRYKWIEGFVTLFLLLSIWGIPIARSLE